MDNEPTAVGPSLQNHILRLLSNKENLRRNTFALRSEVGQPQGFTKELTRIALDDENAFEYVSLEDPQENELLDCMFFLAVNQANHALLLVKTSNVKESFRAIQETTQRKVSGINTSNDRFLVYDLRVDKDTHKFFVSKSVKDWDSLRNGLKKIKYFTTLYSFPQRFLDWIVLTSQPEEYMIIIFDCVEFVKNIGVKLLRLENSQLNRSYSRAQLYDFTISDTWIEASSRGEMSSAKSGNLLLNSALLFLMVALILPLYYKIFFA